jgi:hypothetical protein
VSSGLGRGALGRPVFTDQELIIFALKDAGRIIRTFEPDDSPSSRSPLFDVCPSALIGSRSCQGTASSGSPSRRRPCI